MITITKTDHDWFEGYINKRLIISVCWSDYRKEIMIGSSCCLPTNIKEAKLCLECFQKTIEEAENYFKEKADD